MAKKKALVKPVPQTKTYYNYNECRNYLQAKYGYNERDYAGRFTYNKQGKPIACDDSKPDQDFWLWVVDRFDVNNGTFLTFSVDDLPAIDEEWVRTIYYRYVQEFGNEEGKVELYAYW